MSSQKIIKLLIFIGSILIFGSWIVENYLQKKWEGLLKESGYIRSLTSAIETDSHISEFEKTHFNNRWIKDSSNEWNKVEALNAALEYCDINLDVREMLIKNLSLNEARFPKSWCDLQLDSCRLLRSDLETYRQSRDSNEIDLIYRQIHFASRQGIIGNVKAVDEINNYRKLLTTKSEKTNITFLWLYVIGSICLGLAFLFRKETSK